MTMGRNVNNIKSTAQVRHEFNVTDAQQDPDSDHAAGHRRTRGHQARRDDRGQTEHSAIHDTRKQKRP
jgi:hypothetical protein